MLEHVFATAGDLSVVSDDELSLLLREASAAVNRAEAERLVVAAEWDRRPAWANDGAYNGRCWLAAECSLSRRVAHSVLRTARVVASAPAVAAAVAEASLPVAKAEVVASVVTAGEAPWSVGARAQAESPARQAVGPADGWAGVQAAPDCEVEGVLAAAVWTACCVVVG